MFRKTFLLFLILAFYGAFAEASTLTMLASPNFPTHLSDVVTHSFGGEKSFKLSRSWEVGGGYDRMPLDYADGAQGYLRFYNLITRFHVPGLGALKLETKIGASQNVVLDGTLYGRVSKLAPSGGIGLSYPISYKGLTLTPQIGMRLVRNAPGSTDPGPTGLSGVVAMLLVYRF